LALGIFVKGWTLETATERFLSNTKHAFELRKALQVPVLSKLAEPFCDYRYRRENLEDAVKGLGPEGYLFGQSRGQITSGHGDRVKVGLVACQEGRLRTCLLAVGVPLCRKIRKEYPRYLQRERTRTIRETLYSEAAMEESNVTKYPVLKVQQFQFLTCRNSR